MNLISGRALEVAIAFKHIQVVKSVLEEKRVNIETFYHEIYNAAVTLAEKVGISGLPFSPRRCGRQTQSANTPCSSVEEFLRREITVPFFDYLLQQVTERLTTLQELASLALRRVPPIPPITYLTATSLNFQK
jgi:hypothetical protein